MIQWHSRHWAETLCAAVAQLRRSLIDEQKVHYVCAFQYAAARPDEIKSRLSLAYTMQAVWDHLHQ